MRLNRVYCVDCREAIKQLKDDSVQLVVTSPPYALQRKKQYDSVSPDAYPAFTLSWVKALFPKLKEDGVIALNLAEYVSNGVMSTYAMETIVSIVEETPLKLLDVVEWVNSSPSSLGRPYRPRRGNQQIYLLSKLTTDKVKIFPLAVGKLSSYGVVTDISNRLDKAEKTNKLIRGKNVLVHSASNTERGLRHPAMFPLAIPEFFINLFTTEDDLVLDPFCGSGTTCRIAKRLNRKYLGFDTCERYCKTAEKTLRKIKRGDYIGKSNPNISKSSSVKG